MNDRKRIERLAFAGDLLKAIQSSPKKQKRYISPSLESSLPQNLSREDILDSEPLLQSLIETQKSLNSKASSIWFKGTADTPQNNTFDTPKQQKTSSSVSPGNPFVAPYYSPAMLPEKIPSDFLARMNSQFDDHDDGYDTPVPPPSRRPRKIHLKPSRAPQFIQTMRPPRAPCPAQSDDKLLPPPSPRPSFLVVSPASKHEDEEEEPDPLRRFPSHSQATIDKSRVHVNEGGKSILYLTSDEKEEEDDDEDGDTNMNEENLKVAYQKPKLPFNRGSKFNLSAVGDEEDSDEDREEDIDEDEEEDGTKETIIQPSFRPYKGGKSIISVAKGDVKEDDEGYYEEYNSEEDDYDEDTNEDESGVKESVIQPNFRYDKGGKSIISVARGGAISDDEGEYEEYNSEEDYYNEVMDEDEKFQEKKYNNKETSSSSEATDVPLNTAYTSPPHKLLKRKQKFGPGNSLPAPAAKNNQNITIDKTPKRPVDKRVVFSRQRLPKPKEPLIEGPLTRHIIHFQKGSNRVIITSIEFTDAPGEDNIYAFLDRAEEDARKAGMPEDFDPAKLIVRWDDGAELNAVLYGTKSPPGDPSIHVIRSSDMWRAAIRSMRQKMWWSNQNWTIWWMEKRADDDEDSRGIFYDTGKQMTTQWCMPAVWRDTKAPEDVAVEDKAEKTTRPMADQEVSAFHKPKMVID